MLVTVLYFEITEYAHFLLYDHVAFALIILDVSSWVRVGCGGREGGEVMASVGIFDELAYLNEPRQAKPRVMARPGQAWLAKSYAHTTGAISVTCCVDRETNSRDDDPSPLTPLPSRV